MLVQNSQHALNRFMTPTTWASICLFVISLAVYHATTYNEFVWDSTRYLNFNELWVSSLRPEHLIWMFVTTDMSNWHPLTWFSWALDYQFYGGLSPAGFHFTNNVLHGVCSILVYVLGLKIFLLNTNENSKKISPNSVQLGAMGAALLFAVHPQHVESVAWVAERKDLLCFLFSMLSLIKYLDYGIARDNKTKKHLQLSVFFFILAGLSKPMAVTMPALLLVLDFFPLQRTPWNKKSPHRKTSSLPVLLQEKWPFFLLAFTLILVTLSVQTIALKEVPLWVRMFNGINSIQFYLEKLAWPSALSPFYPFSITEKDQLGWSDIQPLIFFLVISLVSVVAWRRNRPAVLAGWVFYLISLSPVLGIVTAFGSQGAADRYAYLPTLPFYYLLSGTLLWGLSVAGRWQVWIYSFLVLAIATGLALTTRSQVDYWHDEVTLWSRALQFEPEHPFINHQIGAAELNQGNLESAAMYFDRATQFGSERVDLVGWRALVYMQLGRYQDAIDAHVELARHAKTRQLPHVDILCVQYNLAWNLALTHNWKDSTTLFENLSVNGPYGEVSKKWLEWLANLPQSGDEGLGLPDMDHLPGPCLVPLLEMRRQKLTVNAVSKPG